MSFNFSELSDFKKDILNLSTDIYPKETKKFLKKEAGKLAKIAKNRAKSEVGKKTGNYLKGFKSGKVYKYDGADSCRAYNSSPHAHMIEYGHMQKDANGKTSGFASGKHVLTKSESEFSSEFASNVDEFIDEMLNRGIK